MKKTTLLLIVCLALSISSLWGQKVAITGMNHISGSAGDDGFTFVALEDLSAGEVIYFTDNEYSDAANAFTFGIGTTGEGVIKYTVGAGGLAKGVVVFMNETGSNSFTITCSSGNCGTSANSTNPANGSFNLATNGDGLYAYSDTDENVLNGVTEIYSVMYTGSGESPVQNGGNIPANQNPVGDFPNAIVVDGFPPGPLPDAIGQFGPDRTEFKFTPASVRENVTKIGLENPNNYVSYQSQQFLSTLAFTNILPVASDPAVTLTASTNSINEDAAGVVTITATLDAAATSATTINLNIGGTAIQGGDYSLSDTSISIANGTTTGSITLDPTSDSTLETNETAILTITSGTGYDPGSPSSQAITILNDDTLIVTPVVAITGAVLTNGGTEGFSFVALDNITAGTQVYFTENPFDNSLLNFSGSEAVVLWTAPAGGVTRGQVIVATEGPSNTFTTTCDSGTCGTVTSISGNFDFASNGESLFAYTDSDTDHTNGITAISAVLFAGTSTTPGGNIPTGEDPTGVYVGSVLVDGFPSTVPARVEYDPSKRGVTVDQANFQNTNNWLFGQTPATLDTTPFANIIIASGSSLPTVSVAVSPTEVLEDSGMGMVFTFTASQNVTSDVTVNFTVGGTAEFMVALGSDYTVGGAASFLPTAGTVVIPNGTNSAQVTLTPIADSDVEIQETIELMIASGTGYLGGSPNDATGKINNDDTSDSMPLVAITGLNHVTPDGFSFVAARDIPANSVIYFTENAFDSNTLIFGSGEGVLQYTSPGTVIPKGDVIVVKEPSSNTFELTCNGDTGAACGSIALISNTLAVDTFGEHFYAYEDDDTDPTNGVVDIYAVIYTGPSSSITGGLIPVNNDPSGIFTNALVVDGFPAAQPDRTEYDPTKRNIPVNDADFENIANWLHAQANADLSPVPFTSLDIVDATPPVVSCPGSLANASVDANCQFALLDYTSFANVTDNVDPNPTITQSPAAGTLVGTGITVITLTATDASGNSASCTYELTVIDSTTPTAVCQNTTVQLDASGNATITAADIDGGSTDNCGIASLAVSPSTFTIANVGSNTVTMTVNDTSGNTATCTAIVTVEDNVAPTALCQDSTVQLDGSGNASIVAADVDNGSNDVSGIASLSVSPSSFDCSDLGANTVTLTVIDNNGNTSTCTATVTVEDTDPPVLTCGANIVQTSPTGNPLVITITPPTVIDNCDTTPTISGVATLPDTSTFNLGASTADYTFPLGITTIVWSAPDAEGNTGTCIQTITISTPPTVNVPNVVNQTQATAGSNIVAANLVVGDVTTANDDTVPAGNVISQNPSAGSSAFENSPVDLVVSLGPSDITGPIFTGLSPNDNSIDVSVFVVPAITFDEPIQWKSNPDPVVVFDITNNIEFEVIDENSDFSIANGGTTFAFNPVATLDANTEYEIRIGNNTFEDALGNMFGGVPSLGWTFTTRQAPCMVMVETQPEDVTICEGPNPFAFSVQAAGPGILSYNWEESDDNGTTWTVVTLNNPTYNFGGAAVGANGRQYRVTVTSDNGTPADDTDDCSVTSDPATLSVNALPAPLTPQITLATCQQPGEILLPNVLGADEEFQVSTDGGVSYAPLGGNSYVLAQGPTAAMTLMFRTVNTATGCEGEAFIIETQELVCPDPEIIIDDVTLAEGTGGTTTFVFTVTLSQASSNTITVDYETIDGTALATEDYTEVEATLTFNPGETSKSFGIDVNPDSEFESDETFFIQLVDPVNAAIADNEGIGTILNDDVEGCTSPSNVALNKPASQSSTYGNGIASFANDGNLSGSSPWDADLQHTNDDATGPWWEVDLGSDHDLEEVVIHNRTNGFQDRLRDFYVFVSDAPFSASATASDLVGDVSVWNYYFEGPAGALETIPSDVNGRYVRIQLSGQGFLHMAELELMGCPSGPDVCEGAEPVVITAAGPFLDSGSPEQLVASPAGGTWSGQISATGLFDPSIGAGDYIITYSYTNGDGCTQSDTVTVMVDRDNDVPEPCDGSHNVALNKPASQSSTYGNGEAFYANDGNLEGGSPWSADLQHTVSGEAQPWWEVDLGSAHELTEVKLYNRTNRLQSRLNNFYIFVSDSPFSGSLLDQLGDPNIESIFFEGEAGLVESFATMATGRYVRIQLQGSGTLHMAEVEVYGCPTDPSICDGSLPVSITPAGPFLDTEGEQQLIGSPLGGTWSGAVSSDGIFNPSALGAGNYEATYTFTNENGCTKSDTITIVVNNEGGSACTEAYNLALDGTASHSSTYGNGEAFYANDGNQSGSSPWSADLQHTLDEDSQPWWEVDLGEMATIERVVIYNRTDKLQSRLNNFYVLYSDSPFGTQSLDELLADTNIGREFFSGAAGLEEEFTVDVMARYVRVQKTGSGPLHMAEVEVYGCPFAAPSLRANLNTFNVWPNPASEDAKASFENPTNVLSLMIYDMQGRIVKVYAPSELNAGMVMDLNLNTLAPGVYIIRTEDERGIHFEKQLVIKR